MVRGQVFGPHAQHFGVLAVGKNQSPVFGANDHAHRAVFKDAAQAFFVLLAVAFQLFAIGNVFIHPHRRALEPRYVDALPRHHGHEHRAVVALKTPFGPHFLADTQQRRSNLGKGTIAFVGAKHAPGHGLPDDILALEPHVFTQPLVDAQDDAVGSEADTVGCVFKDHLLLFEQFADLGLLAIDLLPGTPLFRDILHRKAQQNAPATVKGHEVDLGIENIPVGPAGAPQEVGYAMLKNGARDLGPRRLGVGAVVLDVGRKIQRHLAQHLLSLGKAIDAHGRHVAVNNADYRINDDDGHGRVLIDALVVGRTLGQGGLCLFASEPALFQRIPECPVFLRQGLQLVPHIGTGLRQIRQLHGLSCGVPRQGSLRNGAPWQRSSASIDSPVTSVNAKYGAPSSHARTD